MVGNGTFWAIAYAAQDIDATDQARRLCSNVLVRAEEIGICGEVIRRLLVFELPDVLCPIDLFEICDAGVPRIPATSPTSEFLDNRWCHGEDSR